MAANQNKQACLASSSASAAIPILSDESEPGMLGIDPTTTTVVPSTATAIVPRVPLSPMENLGVGALGGAMETCLQMPILTYKFCLQEGRPLPTSIKGWYRGVAVQAGTVAPITALQFMVHGLLQKMVLLGNSNTNLSEWEIMGTAAGAGAVSAIVYSPVDLITIQQQKLQQPPLQTLKFLHGHYGLAGVYRGFASCACREAVYTAGYLGLAPVLTARIVESHYFFATNNRENHYLGASILGACLAGTMAAVLTHPMDTAKTCVQSDMSGQKWTNARTAIPQLLQSGGIASLYRGMMPRTIRLCGAFFVCLLVRDKAVDMKTQLAQQQ